ncbi:twin-arginine translocase subunit TatB [Palleronia sediminis]|uniref:Sec-independent protein translocase protein TatB n=1 Tax=Palleronia sediminis TaxID=2547833 RepID=A0A4V3BA11_9RHOB|nr:Sec-independent protein translocase protein TatB [Palleronia sediminis]TDL81329.1 twin-arginine translocase subunit TatB [Palleronia sediminis]
MFDIGMTELMVIGIVALIVVGPKDLPGMFRTLGRTMGKMRGMAREFQRAMEDAADEAGVKDMRSDLKGWSNPKKLGLDRLDEATKDLRSWDPDRAGKTTGHAAKRPDAARAKGPATQALTEERAAQAERIREAAAARAQARRDAEAAKAAKAETPGATPEPAPTPEPAATTPEPRE